MTRREFALSALAAELTPVRFRMPAGACDCHTHVFPAAAQFPFSPRRLYTPPPASPQELRALHRALGIARVVIVTPSVYGTDNAATLFGIQTLGAAARGVAVIGEQTSEAELDAMHKAGMRGIRLNLATAGMNDPAVARRLFQNAVERMARRGWHVQLFTSPPVIAAIHDLVLASPVPVVFDHFGGAQAAQGLAQPGFGELLALLRSGKAYVKISGAYRASTQRPDYSDTAPLARALIAANPERILWGTDWPHPDSSQPPGRKPTGIAPPIAIDDGLLLNQFALWAPDAALRRQILTRNPARLYGF